jgi:hypothetical protein
MEPSFDLDINNYTSEDLMNFFKLGNPFSLEELAKKEYELATNILSVDNHKYNPKIKFDIINFIKLAKDVLISFRHDMETNKEMKKNIERFVNRDKDPRVGRIINPLSSHQTLEDTIIPKDSINGYNYDVTTSIYQFNTIARNDFFNSTSSDSTYDLGAKWKNVISVSLSAVTIPNVMYAFSFDEGTDQIYIEEDNTGLSGIVTIPAGNYSPFDINLVNLNTILFAEASFPEALSKAINTQLGTYDPNPDPSKGPIGRFSVTIDLSNRKTTISNNTHTFTMITVGKDVINDPNIPKNTDGNSRCGNPFSKQVFIDYGVNPPDKRSLPVLVYVSTMGYLMGYREIIYGGSKSYTSESIFTNVYSNYIYFCLDDYTSSQQLSNTYAMGAAGVMIPENILGLVPINSNLFQATFDNNANFIYKKREYFGPVDISRITIKLLNQKGNLVNLHNSNFNFTLQVKTIYNLTEKSKINLRGVGVF